MRTNTPQKKKAIAAEKKKANAIQKQRANAAQKKKAKAGQKKKASAFQKKKFNATENKLDQVLQKLDLLKIDLLGVTQLIMINNLGNKPTIDTQNRLSSASEFLEKMRDTMRQTEEQADKLIRKLETQVGNRDAQDQVSRAEKRQIEIDKLEILARESELSKRYRPVDQVNRAEKRQNMMDQLGLPGFPTWPVDQVNHAEKNKT